MNTNEAVPRVRPQAAGAGDPEIAREVRAIIAHQCDKSVDQVTPDVALEGGLGVDSLALIEINVALEERFKIVTPDLTAHDQAQIRTVGDVITFVEAQLAAQHGRGGAR